MIPAQLVLAWTFVGLRCLHSFIQLTSNRVMHRFRVYVLGTLCVFGMWVCPGVPAVSESTTAQELARRVLALAGGATASAGIGVDLAEPGRVHLGIDRRDDLLQFKGYFHGGVISGLADLAAGGAVTRSAAGTRRRDDQPAREFLAPAKASASSRKAAS